MTTTATIDQLQKALKEVNKKQGYKLEFNRIEQKTKNRVLFTIKSASKIPGSRTSSKGRNLAKASWHAHGYLFDAILSINPDAIIFSLGKRIDIDGGNWEDKNVGSMIAPMYFSETSNL